MAVKWQNTRYPGVRFYEHSTRKHGVRLDRYFAIRLQQNGRRREEGLGWASDGWTEAKAAGELGKLKAAAQTGEGPTSLADKRRLAEEKRKSEQAHLERETREALTFSEAFSRHYFPATSATKSARSCQRESSLLRLWIAPVLGALPLKKISPLHLERVRKNMRDAGLSVRSQHYAMQVTRQVFNYCRRIGLYQKEPPTKKITSVRGDGRRIRFLSRSEARRLLELLVAKSTDTHDMTLLSLHCGLRAGEIFSLTWGDVDFPRKVLTLRDTKSGHTRPALMTDDVHAMLSKRRLGAPGDLVFPSRSGGKREQVSKSFNRVVEELGFNDGVADSRHKVVFHTCRHSYASWLVQDGVDLYVVQKLMGHASIAMTQRYSHLAPGNLQNAVARFQTNWEGSKEVASIAEVVSGVPKGT